MPRHPRLDVPYTLRHVMARGLERRAIFRDAADRADFVAHLVVGNYSKLYWPRIMRTAA
jgi:hypothetical protein